MVILGHLQGHLDAIPATCNQGHSLNPCFLNIATLNGLEVLHQADQHIGSLGQGKLLSWTDARAAVEARDGVRFKRQYFLGTQS